MKYKHSTPEYVPEPDTMNDHAVEWGHIKLIIDERGFITDTRMDSICLKYGKGVNRNNVKYRKYLTEPNKTRRARLVPVT